MKFLQKFVFLSFTFYGQKPNPLTIELPDWERTIQEINVNPPLDGSKLKLVQVCIDPWIESSWTNIMFVKTVESFIGATIVIWSSIGICYVLEKYFNYSAPAELLFDGGVARLHSFFALSFMVGPLVNRNRWLHSRAIIRSYLMSHKLCIKGYKDSSPAAVIKFFTKKPWAKKFCDQMNANLAKQKNCYDDILPEQLID